MLLPYWWRRFVCPWTHGRKNSRRTTNSFDLSLEHRTLFMKDVRSLSSLWYENDSPSLGDHHICLLDETRRDKSAKIFTFRTRGHPWGVLRNH